MVGERVDVYRPTTSTDGYGAVEYIYPDDPSFSVVAGVEPLDSSENHDGRDATVATANLYTAADAGILPADRVKVRGVMHDVLGPPDVWANPFTNVGAGAVVKVRAVTG